MGREGSQSTVCMHYLGTDIRMDTGRVRGCETCLQYNYIHMHTSCTCFTLYAVVIDVYPNTATVEQGTTVILVCRVVGVPSTTVLSYRWTCPGGYCGAGEVDPEWAAKIQQGNILVVNVRRQNADGGSYNCIVHDNSQKVGTASYLMTVASEYVVAL